MAEVKWIKISTGLFDDEAIQIILDLPEGSVLLEIWLRLLIAAGKCNDSGILYLKENIPYTPELLATIFNKKEKQINYALQTFSKFNMIKILENKNILIQNWEKYQNLSGLEQIREYNRLAQQKSRKKKKELALLNTNNVNNVIDMSLTHHEKEHDCHETDIDIDIDNKKDKSFLLSDKENKSEDPYMSNKTVEKFKKDYLNMFGDTPYLSSFNINKLIELSHEVKNFENTIPIVLEKLKNLDFNLPNFKPNHMWLLSNDNYMKVYSGMYDKTSKIGEQNGENQRSTKYDRENGWS